MGACFYSSSSSVFYPVSNIGRLKSLGENYNLEAIKERIIKARNGIRDLDTPKPDYNAWLEKYEPIKLKGFKALYYHYYVCLVRYEKGNLRKEYASTLEMSL